MDKNYITNFGSLIKCVSVVKLEMMNHFKLFHWVQFKTHRHWHDVASMQQHTCWLVVYWAQWMIMYGVKWSLFSFVFPAQAVNAIAPGSCCFQFFTGQVPQKQIISVVKTHSNCHEKGFVYVCALLLYNWHLFMSLEWSSPEQWCLASFCLNTKQKEWRK